MTGKKDLTAEVARVAYELFEQRGRAHGDHLGDWLEAERIVMKRHVGEIADVAATVKKTRLRKAATGSVSAATKPTGKTAAERKKTTEKASTPKKRTTAKKQPE